MKQQVCKTIIAIMMIVVICLCLTSCTQVGNRVVGGIDVQTFNYAYVVIGDKVIEGVVELWRDYDSSDVVQVKINGIWYLSHYSNIILVTEECK